MKRTCKQCGKEFYLSQSELNFYKKRKLAFPKRCKECRAMNKSGQPKATEGEKTVDGLDSASSALSQTKQAQTKEPKKNGMKLSFPVIGAGVILLIVVIILCAYFALGLG